MPESSNDKTIPVRVALRIRPLVPKEIGDGCQECIAVTPGEPQVVMGSDKAFTYDYVYGSTSKQNELYEKTVLPLLEKLYKGYNATVLAYGQTGSGKTYTMGTSFTMCTNSEDKDIQGVIPRVVGDIFQHMEKKKQETEFLLKCSFLEIHNEEIHDLLSTSSVDKIAIRENVEGDIKISGLSELPVTSGEEMVQFLCNGSASRATGATAMNSTSSRSHAIFTIIMEQKDKTGDGDFRRAKFHLVDLAGSERAKRTNAQGERFKEGVNINKGLLALGNVISALSDENRKSNAHVPYRDSKLTRLLQDSLGGNSNTAMIACVSPADSNYEETLNTLRYADRARQIKNKPIVNRDPVAAEMAKLKQQVQMLQLQLLQGQTINGGLDEGNEMAMELKDVLDRVKQLEEENLKLSHELHNSINQNTTMYEKVLMAELSRDKLIRQYDELKHYLTDKKVKLMPSLTETIAESNETNLADELQKKFQQFEESCTLHQPANDEHDNSQNSINHNESHDNKMDHDGSSPSSPAVIDSSFESQHALRQAELARQVQELSKALSMKQELAEKMEQTEGAMNERMVKQYEVTVRELESEINKLEKEKAELSVALSAVKTSTTESDSSRSRNRIKELESKITEMKKKQVELQKLQRLKQQGDATISKLNTEIQGMKSMRVKLMRQMKEESERFRNLKKEKEREIMQLKQKDRKRQFEYTKLQNIHQKQQAVLKRKTEEAAAANKRLHDALSKRKEAAEKRDNYQYIQNKHSDNLIPRMKSWLSHEVELLASIAHAKKTLQELIEDRKTISHQLCELRQEQEDVVDQPPAKKMFGMEKATEEKPEQSEKETKVKALEAELKIKSSQIAELQKKIGDADANVSFEKSKHRWNNIHTMAEAKAGLQVLLSMAVDDRSKLFKTEKNMQGDKEDLEELRQSTETLVNNHRKELEFLRRDYDKRVTSLQQEHQEKVLLLLQQMPTEEEKKELTYLRELVKSKDNELEERRLESDMLKQRFAALSEALSSEMSNASAGTEQEDANAVETEEVEDDTDSKDNCYSYYEDEDDDEEEEEDSADDGYNEQNDPEYAPTPIVRRQKSKRSGSSLGVTFSGDICNCSGCCKRGCPCKKRSSHCGEGCNCKAAKCSNRPKDPKTPLLFSGDSFSESDLSTNKENESPFLQIQKKLQLPSAGTTPLSSTNQIVVPKSQEMSKTTEKTQNQNSKSTPKTQQNPDDKNAKQLKTQIPSKSKAKLPQNRSKTTSVSAINLAKAEKWRKIRRKSTVLSKKNGVKSSIATNATPNRNVVRTPGSGFTPLRVNKTPKLQTNGMIKKKSVNGQAKQQKRKLHNPSTLPPFAF